MDSEGDIDSEEGEAGAPAGAPKKKKRERKKYQTTALNAGRCDVKQFFLRIDFVGQPLADNSWRCVLCSIKHPDDLAACLLISREGNSPLHKHLLDSHGVTVLKETQRADAKKAKVKEPVALPGQSKLGFVRVGGARPRSTLEISQAISKMVVLDMHSFRMVESESFQEMKTALLGIDARQPDARKIRDMIDAEERRIRQCMTAFFQSHLVTFGLSGDGKKAEIKGRPMYGVCLHALSKEFDPIVAPLFVGETDSKEALETKRFIVRACAGYKLSAQHISAFTGDEAEAAAGAHLGCVFLRCAPHRISTAVKRTFKALGFLEEGGVLNASKDVVQFLQRRYKARQFSDDARTQINEERAARKLPPILGFTEFSKTRFLGSLLMGKRLVMNTPVILEAEAHAITHQSDDPWTKWPGLKERHLLEWEDISFITQDFVDTMEFLSGELYPTLSDLAPSIQLLQARVWRLGWRQENPQSVDGDPPIDRQEWKSLIGQPFVEQLYKELKNKFDDDLKNPMVLVATLLDPRFRTFLHPIRGKSWGDVQWASYQQLFSTISAKKIDGRTLETRMLSAAVDLYRKFFPDLWERDLQSLPPDVQHIVRAEGRVERHPLWSDLKSWYSSRPVNLTCGGEPVGENTNPIAFWRECNSFASLKVLAQVVLNLPVSALTIERFWSSADKIMDKRRNRLEIDTAGRLIYVRHVWKTAMAMLQRYGGTLSVAGKAFYESLLPFAGVSKE